MATTSTDVTSQTIIDTILADVNAIVPTYSSLVNSYRLLVGAAEEIHRIGGVSPDVLARAVVRFDRTGELIDILIDLLCCKIAFSSSFLSLTSGPVDLFRLLANRLDVADTPHLVAEEILLLEVLRRALDLTGRNPLPPCTPSGPPPVTFSTTCFGQPPPPPIPPIPPDPPPLPPQPVTSPTPPPSEAKPSPETPPASAPAAPSTKEQASTTREVDRFDDFFFSTTEERPLSFSHGTRPRTLRAKLRDP